MYEYLSVSLRAFVKDEEGVATVDWIALSAALLFLTYFTMSEVGDALMVRGGVATTEMTRLGTEYE